MIEVRNLSISYGDEAALQNVSFNLKRGSSCAVIGASGCGKTTLLLALAGLIKPDQGQIMIDGNNLNCTREKTGLVLQDYGLLPWKRVNENISFALEPRGFKRKERKLLAEDVLTSLGMSDYGTRYPAELSGGQRQRVALARTLVLDPDLLLLDEASSALDAITRERIQDLILDIFNKRKLTMVLVTHSIEEAVVMGQRIILMANGVIVEQIENDCFGMESIRDQSRFLSMCGKVRKALYKYSIRNDAEFKDGD